MRICFDWYALLETGIWRESSDLCLACWVVVFSPQIIENFRRSSAEGLSIEFIIIWLLGDFANIIGAVLQRVLPTMVSLRIIIR